jgi:hypothetical protein
VVTVLVRMIVIVVAMRIQAHDSYIARFRFT